MRGLELYRDWDDLAAAEAGWGDVPGMNLDSAEQRAVEHGLGIGAASIVG